MEGRGSSVAVSLLSVAATAGGGFDPGVLDTLAGVLGDLWAQIGLEERGLRGEKGAPGRGLKRVTRHHRHDR
jgi:hypothetical protein